MLHLKTLSELAQGLKSKAFSSVELTQAFLDRIRQHDKILNSFITVTEDQALTQARAADALLASGQAHPLTGIPLAQKDIFCTQGIKTSCGSKMLDNFIAPYNATLIEKFNTHGMVMLGKTNMDEFAMGSSTEHSYYGPTRNPWHTDYVPGGSSGGSAACVAARLAPASTGTDTGGSIRQPASFCGITGLKPTYGRVSRYGMIAFASSMDQAGPMTQTCEDAALMLNVMAGFDLKDSTSVNQPVIDYTKDLRHSIKGMKIGLPKEYFNEHLNPDMAKILEASIQELKKLGADFQEISLPHSKLSVETYYVLAPAEASSNLARYDGVRCGHRCENPKNLEDLYRRSRTEGFGEEVKRRIMMGTFVLSAGSYEAFYLKAQKIRRLVKNDFVEAFKKVDVILGPTSPTAAFKLNERAQDPIAMYLADVYTIATNLAGLPGLSLPAGFHQGLPVGVQLIGNYFEEAKILNLGHQYQEVTDWHRALPKEFA